MTHNRRQLCNVIFRLILAGNCLETLFIAKLIVYKSGLPKKKLFVEQRKDIEIGQFAFETRIFAISVRNR